MPLPRALPALALLASVAACTSRSVEGPSLAPQEPPIAAGARDPEGAWTWFLDAAHAEGTLDASAAALPAGLRADVVPAASVPARADTRVLSEGAATPVPAGGGTWPRSGYRSPSLSTAGPGWDGAKVAVEWMVSARRRGACLVDVEAVPRLLNCNGCVAVLSELAVRRTLSFDDAIVIAVDPQSPAAPTGRLLVGAAGPTGKLVLRVRG